MESEIPQHDYASPEITSPYSVALHGEAIKHHPEKTREFGILFEDISTQIADNFSFFNTPDATIPYSKLTVGADIINKINGKTPDGSQENTSDNVPENRVTYCFTAFQEVGNPMAIEDMAIDEYFRNLNRVANALKNKETPPNIDIYLLDLPTAFGGKVTEKFVEKIDSEGIGALGELFSEFIETTLPTDISNTSIRLHGVSMDSLADQTFIRLNSDVQKKTQRLLDNPAGTHNGLNILRTAQLGAGLILEAGLAGIKPTAKALNAARPGFKEQISNEKQVTEDDNEQKKLKGRAFRGIMKKLGKGTPLHLGNPDGKPWDEDTINRGSFIRKGLQDKLTTGPLNYVRALIKRNDPMIVEQKGKSLEFTVNKPHIFFYENFDRWAKNIDFCLDKATS